MSLVEDTVVVIRVNENQFPLFLLSGVFPVGKVRSISSFYELVRVIRCNSSTNLEPWVRVRQIFPGKEGTLEVWKVGWKEPRVNSERNLVRKTEGGSLVGRARD